LKIKIDKLQKQISKNSVIESSRKSNEKLDELNIKNNDLKEIKIN